MFSRIAAKLHGESNALYTLRDALKAEGHAIQDLISGNINEQGFVFPQDLVEEILVRASRRCEIYRPDSFGQRQAREAVSEYYRYGGHAIDGDRILITPGSSLSYWYCFKLLADEGDEILCPCPSYPLFDYIALLSGVRLIPYRLDEARQWAIDIDHLEACVSTRTRALVLISPHNPTGHVASSGRDRRIGRHCAPPRPGHYQRRSFQRIPDRDKMPCRVPREPMRRSSSRSTAFRRCLPCPGSNSDGWPFQGNPIESARHCAPWS